MCMTNHTNPLGNWTDSFEYGHQWVLHYKGFQWRIQNEMEGGAEYSKYWRIRGMGQVFFFFFFYTSTVKNKENNKLVLKNFCNFQSSIGD